jgi:predicted nucleic acid-binding protein
VAHYFFDSSALAKIYHPELGTDEVTRIFSEPDRRINISRLTLVEIQSVFAIKVRTGEISRDDAKIFRQRMVHHIASRDFNVFTVTDSHFAGAERLVLKYGFDYRLRTLDALHLAVAVDLRTQGLVDRFVSADRAMCDVAAREQFSVLNPEEP